MGAGYAHLRYQHPAQEFTFSAEDIDIPHTSYTLPNGLRLIVYEDHKTPFTYQIFIGYQRFPE